MANIENYKWSLLYAQYIIHLPLIETNETCSIKINIKKPLVNSLKYIKTENSEIKQFISSMFDIIK